MSKLKSCQYCDKEVSRGSAWCTQHTVNFMIANALNNHAWAVAGRSNFAVDAEQASLEEKFAALDWYFQNTDWSAFKLHHWSAAYIHLLESRVMRVGV